MCNGFLFEAIIIWATKQLVYLFMDILCKMWITKGDIIFCTRQLPIKIVILYSFAFINFQFEKWNVMRSHLDGSLRGLLMGEAH